jgi:hypothetical protein
VNLGSVVSIVRCDGRAAQPAEVRCPLSRPATGPQGDVASGAREDHPGGRGWRPLTTGRSVIFYMA